MPKASDLKRPCDYDTTLVVNMLGTCQPRGEETTKDGKKQLHVFTLVGGQISSIGVATLKKLVEKRQDLGIYEVTPKEAEKIRNEAKRTKQPISVAFANLYPKRIRDGPSLGKKTKEAKPVEEPKKRPGKKTPSPKGGD